MRWSRILIAFCVILNFYQSRYIILQFIDVCLQFIILFSTDTHRYIQQQLNSYSQNLKFCPDTQINYNLSQYEYECPQHRYTIRIIERRPLIIYIEQFLTQDEVQHLIELVETKFVQSAVVQPNGTSFVDNSYRSSNSAYLGRGQTPVVKCLEQRFAQFQGNIDPLRIEPLQVVKYDENQQFKPHVDWFYSPDQMSNGGQRITTFFTYLYANCSTCETEFINIKFNSSLHSNFCEYLTCDDISKDHGIRFRPIPGNSIFWFNIDEHGQGDNASYHAGLPPSSNGRKIGLNTWTRETIFVH